MRLPYEERFWSRVRKTNRCWLWTAGRGRERLRLLQAVAYKRREVGAPDRLRVAARPHPRRDEAPPHLSEPAVRESCAPPSSHTVGERLGEQSSCEAVVQSTGLSERARPHAREHRHRQPRSDRVSHLPTRYATALLRAEEACSFYCYAGCSCGRRWPRPGLVARGSQRSGMGARLIESTTR